MLSITWRILTGVKWYSSVFDVKAYFDQPFYVGFTLGGFELGLDPNMKGVVRE